MERDISKRKFTPCCDKRTYHFGTMLVVGKKFITHLNPDLPNYTIFSSDVPSETSYYDVSI